MPADPLLRDGLGTLGACGFRRPLRLCWSPSRGQVTPTIGRGPGPDDRNDQPPSHQFLAVMRKILVDAPMVFLTHWTRDAPHKTRLRDLRLNLGAIPHDKLVGLDLGP